MCLKLALKRTVFFPIMGKKCVPGPHIYWFSEMFCFREDATHGKLFYFENKINDASNIKIQQTSDKCHNATNVVMRQTS